MSLLFRHNQERPEYGGVGKETGTIAFEKPHVLEILQELRRSFTKSVMSIPKITVNIGGAFVHKSDCFNKKVGRALATSRVKPIEMMIDFDYGSQRLDAVHFRLTGVDNELQVQYVLNCKIYRDSGVLRIMGIQTRSWL